MPAFYFCAVVRFPFNLKNSAQSIIRSPSAVVGLLHNGNIAIKRGLVRERARVSRLANPAHQLRSDSSRALYGKRYLNARYSPQVVSSTASTSTGKKRACLNRSKAPSRLSLYGLSHRFSW